MTDIVDAIADKLLEDHMTLMKENYRLKALMREMGECLGKTIEFVPTGYGIERQCWEAFDKYKEMTNDRT